MRLLDGQAQPMAFDRVNMGFRPLYRDGERNHCPACGGSNWIIGRILAECGFCATALPLDHISTNYQACSHVVLQPARRGRGALRLVA